METPESLRGFISRYKADLTALESIVPSTDPNEYLALLEKFVEFEEQYNDNKWPEISHSPGLWKELDRVNSQKKETLPGMLVPVIEALPLPKRLKLKDTGIFERLKSIYYSPEVWMLAEEVLTFDTLIPLYTRLFQELGAATSPEEIMKKMGEIREKFNFLIFKNLPDRESLFETVRDKLLVLKNTTGSRDHFYKSAMFDFLGGVCGYPDWNVRFCELFKDEYLRALLADRPYEMKAALHSLSDFESEMRKDKAFWTSILKELKKHNRPESELYEYVSDFF